MGLLGIFNFKVSWGYSKKLGRRDLVWDPGKWSYKGS